MTPKEAALESLAHHGYDTEQIVQKAHNAGKPTYSHAVGDCVKVGALIDCVVDEVFEDGAYYGVAFKSEARDGGQKKLQDGYRIFPWIDVRPICEHTDKLFTDKNSIRLNYQNATVESLLFQHYGFGVDFNPDYQRGRVWDDKDKELLLDSIFMGADIGKFVFRSRSDGEWALDHISYEIIDGKQRMLTLLEFFENRFLYKGVYYNELQAEDKRTFLNTPVVMADLQEYDRARILKVFLLLNRGGRPVSDEVIHNAEELLREADRK